MDLGCLVLPIDGCPAAVVTAAVLVLIVLIDVVCSVTFILKAGADYDVRYTRQGGGKAALSRK